MSCKKDIKTEQGELEKRGKEKKRQERKERKEVNSGGRRDGKTFRTLLQC